MTLNRLLAPLLALSLGPVFLGAAPSPPETHAIVRRLDDLFRSSSSVGKMELISKTDTQSRHLTLRIWSKGRDRSLIIIDAPQREAGTATLKVGNNLWNYLPKIARSIRVPPSMMLASWMGTDFTNDDLVKESSYEHDFVFQPITPCKDPAGWLLTGTVKPGIVGRWQKVEWVMDPAGQLPLLARYYDRKGALARTMAFSDVKSFGERRMPTLLVLESVDQAEHHMEMRYLDMKFDVPLSDDTFSLSQLESQQ